MLLMCLRYFTTEAVDNAKYKANIVFIDLRQTDYFSQ